MTKVLIDVEEETISKIVRDELLWFYKNADGLNKKELKAIKTTLLFFMTPDDIEETFGDKTYRKYFDLS